MNNLDSASGSHSRRNRYQIVRQILRNRSGDIVTYLGKDNKTQEEVIFKRFLFTESGFNISDDWDYQRRSKLLCSLNHNGIPNYIDFFKTGDSFYLVQKYKQAKSLERSRIFEPDEIKRIAISVLEILVYLQQRTEPVIHGDIKLENILVDDELNVYLVGFGLGQISKQSPWLLAPEQQKDRLLTEAGDLYNLGATLICLFTQTKSAEIKSLIDSQGRIKFKNRVSGISQRLVDWLEKMVAPSPINRYTKADKALKALKPIEVISIPEVRYSSSILEFKPTDLGEKVSQTIAISNTNLDTILEGSWSVSPTNGERRYPKGSDIWISFSPRQFQSNQVNCKINVDPSKLMADKNYERQILLETNSLPKIHSFTVKVKMPPLPTLQLPLISLGALFLIATISGCLGAALMGHNGAINWLLLMLGLGVGSAGGAAAAFNSMPVMKKMIGAIVALSSIVGFLPVMGADVDLIAGFFLGLIVAGLGGVVVKNHLERNIPLKLATIISALTAALGMSLGTEFMDGFLPFVTLALGGTSISLATVIMRLNLQNKALINKYRKNERYLIKP